MSADKRDRERVPILGDLVGEVMVFEPMRIKDVGITGATVETRFPFHLDSLHDLADAWRALDRRQGPRRTFAHQRRRSGHRDLPDRHGIRGAVRAGDGGDCGVPGEREVGPQRGLNSDLPTSDFQFPSPNSQCPIPNSLNPTSLWKLGVGSWELGVGNWKLKVGVRVI
jgi:hypothetical protein